MTTINLHPTPLTAAAFAPFGDVIETQGSNFNPINFGRTERHHDLAKVDTTEQNGHTGISIFRSQPLEGGFPFRVKVLERHPMASQAFISMQRRPFLVLVAPPTTTDQPDVSQLMLFKVGPNQGVNFHRGTWHHYSFSLDSSETTTDFLCIDRCGGDGNNCDEYYFEEGTTEEGKKRDSAGNAKGEETDGDDKQDVVIIHSE